MSKMIRLAGSALFAAALLLSAGTASAQTPTTDPTPSVCYAPFTRDLTVGSTGADVVALQKILVSGGYLVMPAGVAMGYFGSGTQAAAAKFQLALGIAPASGYVGAVTRAYLNQTYKCSVFDYNNDSKVDQTDVQFLFEVAVGSRTCPTGKTCDVTKDGRVTTSDAQALSKTTGATGVPVPTSNLGTNYGQGYLTDGTYITYLFDGVVYTVQTPESLKNRIATKEADGKFTLVGPPPPAPPATATFSVSITAGGGTASDGQTLTVPATGGYSGVKLTVAWAAQNVAACAVQNTTGQFFGGNGLTGSQSFAPLKSTTLQLNCFDVKNAKVLTKTVYIVVASQPTLKVTYPNGGEAWTLGETRSLTVNWTGTTTMLRAQLQAGASETKFVKELFPNGAKAVTGTNEYKIPLTSDIPGGLYSLQICDSYFANASFLCDSSDGAFSIKGSETTTPAGSLVVRIGTDGIKASDGGTLTVPATTNPYTGTLLTVTWNATGVTACSVKNIGGQFFGGAGLTGTKTWGPKQSTTLQLNCYTDPDGSPVLTKTVNVVIRASSESVPGTPPQPVPSGSLSVALADGTVSASLIDTDRNELKVPATINPYTGTLVTVTWKAVGVTACAVKNIGGQFFGGAGLTGSKVWGPKQSTRLQLNCFIDPDGSPVLTRTVDITIVGASVSGTLDYNNDYKIDSADFAFLANLATTYGSCPAGKVCDLNGDTFIRTSDAQRLQGYYGTATLSGKYDYNKDYKLDAADVAILAPITFGTGSCPTGKVCDLNGSSTVTPQDVQILVDYIGSAGSVLGAKTSAVAACYTAATRDLTIGSTGADVTNLQEVLTRDGERVSATGYFAQKTQAAVVKFQTKYSIVPASGYVGPLTRAKLTALYACSVTNPPTPPGSGGGGGGIGTNYGYGYLTDGTYITYLLNNGVYTVQTPASLLGRTVTKGADGKFTLQ